MISDKFFTTLDSKFNIDKLQQETLDVWNRYASAKTEQLSLIYRNGYKDDCWFDGTGSPFQFDKDRQPKRDKNGKIVRRFSEDEFRYINPGLESTELENVYNTLKRQFNLSRYRVAKLGPKRSYGWHKDEEIRIHVPVVTAPGCFIITDDGIASHLPADGGAHVFYANNGYHTALNSDYKIDRLHLLINVI